MYFLDVKNFSENIEFIFSLFPPLRKLYENVFGLEEFGRIGITTLTMLLRKRTLEEKSSLLRCVREITVSKGSTKAKFLWISAVAVYFFQCPLNFLKKFQSHLSTIMDYSWKIIRGSILDEELISDLFSSTVLVICTRQ